MHETFVQDSEEEQHLEMLKRILQSAAKSPFTLSQSVPKMPPHRDHSVVLFDAGVERARFPQSELIEALTQINFVTLGQCKAQLAPAAPRPSVDNIGSNE